MVLNVFMHFRQSLDLMVGGVAARHVWLQSLPPDQVPSCGPGLDYWLDTLPLRAVFEQS